MRFNPYPEEVIFVKKLNKPNCPSLNYNDMVVIQSATLGRILDTKLDFQEHYIRRLLDPILTMAASYMAII